MEQKKKEKELTKELKIEKKKQEEVRKQWCIFMHSRKELKEMERREKWEKEKEKVDAVKRRLAFEEKERKEEEKKKEEQRQKEKESRKQKTPTKKRNVDVVSLFSSDDEPPVKKGKIHIYMYQPNQFLFLCINKNWSVDLVIAVCMCCVSFLA